MTEITIKELRALCTKALLKTGLSQEDVDITVDHYLENEVSGKTSHGMVRATRVPSAIEQFGLPIKAPEITKDQGNIVSIEGHMNMGPALGKAVLDTSIIRTKQHGLSIVGGSHYISNSGSMAYYLRRLTKEGLIGFMSCNSDSLVTAPAGTERLIGTNPIGLGIPSANGEDFIADFATSAIAYGKILVAQANDEDLPEGCLVDKEGNPSTNPQDAFSDGAILPLVDYRGFALGLFVEMISMLFGADVLQKDDFGKDGLFIIALDPSKLDDNFAQRVSHILNYIRNSPPAPGHDSVSIPGDRSSGVYRENLDKGSINVADKTLAKLIQLTE